MISVKMKKQTKNILFASGIIVAIALLLILIYGGQSGWFKDIFTIAPPETNLTPTPNQPTLYSCSQVCSSQGFSQSYSFVNACQPGESKVAYGYQGQNPILTCCCFNQQPLTKYYCCQAMGLKSCYQNACPPAGIQLGVYNSLPECQNNCKVNPTCTETDTGLDYNVFGTCESSVTMTGIADECSSMTTLKEAFCDYNDYKCKYTNYNCPAGTTCSGGKCVQTTECVDGDNLIDPWEEQLQTTSYCYDKTSFNTDHCFEGTDSLIEYYCEPTMSPQSEKNCGSVSYNCNGMLPGSHCEDGACVY